MITQMAQRLGLDSTMDRDRGIQAIVGQQISLEWQENREKAI